jgi:hypothetical protein
MRLYAMGVDWGDGYERHFAWVTTEENARLYFARAAETSPGPCVLIGHGGRELAHRA